MKPGAVHRAASVPPGAQPGGPQTGPDVLGVRQGLPQLDLRDLGGPS